MNYKRFIEFAKSNRGGFIISMIFLAIVFAYGALRSGRTVSTLQEKGQFTVGIVTEDGMTGDHSYIYYKYKINDKIYEARSKYMEGVKIPGGKYVLIYDPDDPLTHVILYNRETKEEFGTMLDYSIGDDEIKDAVWAHF